MLQTVIDNGIATVTFDRPPINAADADTFAQIRDTFRGFADDKTVRVVIFTAAGDRAFFAGVDLKAVAAFDPSQAPASSVLDPGRIAREAFGAVYDCAVPVIAAVNGPAIGGGVALVAVCDLIVAAENATFATTEINVGMLGASAHLSLIVGRHKAREMYFTGTPVTAAELKAIGAIHSVVPREELLEHANELAQSLAQKSPIAMRLAKEAMNRTEFLPLDVAYRQEQDYTNRLMTYADSGEARRAVLEHREPDWQWK